MVVDAQHLSKTCSEFFCHLDDGAFAKIHVGLLPIVVTKLGLASSNIGGFFFFLFLTRSSFTVVIPEYNWLQVTFPHSSVVISLIST